MNETPTQLSAFKKPALAMDMTMDKVQDPDNSI